MGDNETCVYHDDRCAEIKEIKENIKELFGKVNEQGGDYGIAPPGPGINSGRPYGCQCYARFYPLESLDSVVLRTFTSRYHTSSVVGGYSSP